MLYHLEISTALLEVYQSDEQQFVCYAILAVLMTNRVEQKLIIRDLQYECAHSCSSLSSLFIIFIFIIIVFIYYFFS